MKNNPKFKCLVAFVSSLLIPASTSFAGPDPAQATRSDMQRIGHAMEKYIVNLFLGGWNGGPPVEYRVWQGTFDRDGLPIISHADLEKLLVPSFLDELPILGGPK